MKQRRSAVRALIVFLLIICTALIFQSIQPPRASAVYANPEGSSGQHTGVIDWIEWKDLGYACPSSGNRNQRCLGGGGQSRDVVWSPSVPVLPGYWRSIRCEVSSLRGKMRTYEPGDWKGDALARLYNNGQNYISGNQRPNAGSRSGLTIGLGNYELGNGRPDGNQEVTFSVSCKAYVINSQAQPQLAKDTDVTPFRKLPLAGMVVADAEANANNTSGKTEWLAAAPLGAQGDTTWHLLESLRNPSCSSISQANGIMLRQADGRLVQGMRFQTANGNECSGYGPASVNYMAGAQGLTAIVSGNGYGAIALGAVAPETDYGDAPDTYGLAAALDTVDVVGGEYSGDGRRVNLTQMNADGQVGHWASSLPLLGRRVDREHEPWTADTSATADDLHGSEGEVVPEEEDDEDAFAGPIDLRAVPGTSYTLPDIPCAGQGAVRGWVDWNRDGRFDAAEGSTQVECRNSSATLTWAVPEEAVRSVYGEPGGERSFMRLRISDEKNPDGTYRELLPTGISIGGEVEDHETRVRVPTLTLRTVVDNTHAGNIGATPQQWNLTAVSDNHTVNAQGHSEETRVWSGSTYLLSSATQQKGYETLGWTCVESDGTQGEQWSSIFIPNADTTKSAIAIKNSDRTTCTLTVRAKPATFTWDKVDQDGTTPLAGSTWQLRSSSGKPAPTPVTDCVGADVSACGTTPMTDRDPRAGKFRIDGLPWGNTYSVSETTAPTGWEKVAGDFTTTRAHGDNLDLRIEAASTPQGRDALINGAVKNTRQTGMVTWMKQDERANPLSGSEWTLTGPQIPAEGVVVADCVGTHPTACPAGAYRDSNPKVGVLTVTGLAWHDTTSYALVEKTPPAGYILDETPHEFALRKDARDYSFATPFVNRPLPVPVLPLTGGLSTDHFTIGGLGILALALGAAAVLRRKSSTES